jgi:hypothetical protein
MSERSSSPSEGGCGTRSRRRTCASRAGDDTPISTGMCYQGYLRLVQRELVRALAVSLVVIRQFCRRPLNIGLPVEMLLYHSITCHEG